MSKYSKEVKEKAIYLSKKGWSRFRIAKELEVPESTVRNWLYKFKLSHNLTHKIGKQVFSAAFKRKVRLKKYRSYRGTEGKIAPNIIKRNFTATKPDQKWTTDITEFHLFGRKVYLSPILDMYNGEIVSYEISERPVLTQVLSMLDKAFKNRPHSKGCILHSDQGWQY